MPAAVAVRSGSSMPAGVTEGISSTAELTLTAVQSTPATECTDLDEAGLSSSKRMRSSLFESYRRRHQAALNVQDATISVQAVLNKYHDAITRSTVQ